MKQLEVQIMGQSYLLGCPESGEPQLREAVQRVDAAMCKIRSAGKLRARDRIAVLASLNLAFDLVQCESASAEALAAVPAQKSPAEGQVPFAAGDEARVAQLLKRLDVALAGDDHLL